MLRATSNVMPNFRYELVQVILYDALNEYILVKLYIV